MTAECANEAIKQEREIEQVLQEQFEDLLRGECQRTVQESLKQISFEADVRYESLKVIESLFRNVAFELAEGCVQQESLAYCLADRIVNLQVKLVAEEVVAQEQEKEEVEKREKEREMFDAAARSLAEEFLEQNTNAFCLGVANEEELSCRVGFHIEEDVVGKVCRREAQEVIANLLDEEIRYQWESILSSVVDSESKLISANILETEKEISIANTDMLDSLLRKIVKEEIQLQQAEQQVREKELSEVCADIAQTCFIDSVVEAQTMEIAKEAIELQVAREEYTMELLEQVIQGLLQESQEEVVRNELDQEITKSQELIEEEVIQKEIRSCVEETNQSLLEDQNVALETSEVMQKELIRIELLQIL